MGAFDMLRIANTSLGFHQTWLDALANNIANVNTAKPTSENAFQAQMVVARAVPEGGVEVGGIVYSDPEGRVVNDPTSAARNNKVKSKIERRLTQWSQEKGMPVIAGHTHRPVFPEPGEGRYFNDGSCVHPWNITAIEITSGTISLVKWGQKTREDGVVTIGRDVIAGPRPLRDYL